MTQRGGHAIAATTGAGRGGLTDASMARLVDAVTDLQASVKAAEKGGETSQAARSRESLAFVRVLALGRTALGELEAAVVAALASGDSGGAVDVQARWGGPTCWSANRPPLMSSSLSVALAGLGVRPHPRRSHHGPPAVLRDGEPGPGWSSPVPPRPGPCRTGPHRPRRRRPCRGPGLFRRGHWCGPFRPAGLSAGPEPLRAGCRGGRSAPCGILARRGGRGGPALGRASWGSSRVRAVVPAQPETGDLERATARHRHALALRARIGDPAAIATSLEGARRSVRRRASPVRCGPPPRRLRLPGRPPRMCPAVGRPQGSAHGLSTRPTGCRATSASTLSGARARLCRLRAPPWPAAPPARRAARRPADRNSL